MTAKTNLYNYKIFILLSTLSGMKYNQRDLKIQVHLV